MPYILYIILGYLFYVSSILIHILVLKKYIDYTQVNGGRSHSYEEQVKTSIVSIIILVMGLMVMVIYHLFMNFSQTIASVILMGVLTVYWLLGYMMQLFGTKLERRILSFIVLIGLFSHLMLFLVYFIG